MKKDLKRKYENEIHANEIVLLAYYIAAVNIENAYHDIMQQKEYSAFEGICLTDTFQLGESDDGDKLFSDMFPQNSQRVQKQQKAPLRVIMGNPPYSAGQKSANDNAQNQSYPKLEKRIENTYVANVDVTQKRSLYDSYFKAFRWSADRLDKTGGIICFVSNGAWLDSNAGEGFRKCIEQEFTSIYVLNLRGNQRTSGELSRKEGGKVFGSGSRTPISITLLVKNPNANSTKAVIHYHDIGDYLTREEKLALVDKFKSVVSNKLTWKGLNPNEHGDWIGQRNSSFANYIPAGEEKHPNTKSYFAIYSNGLQTSRDAWIYNSSKGKLESNILKTVSFYNEEMERYNKKNYNDKTSIDDFVTYDATKIAWTGSLKNYLKGNNSLNYDDQAIVPSYYRPYFKQFGYYNRSLIDVVGFVAKLFPRNNMHNFVICASGIGVTKEFSVIITDTIPDRELIGKSQCFPLYYYELREKAIKGLFDEEGDSEYIQHDGVSDFILECVQKQYSAKNVSKEDIFYYVYGFLHSPQYRETFANDLKKMLPRLPLVEDAKDFWAFSKAGRKLAELHINYEAVPPAPGVKVTGATKKDFKVAKMRFPRKGEKETIIYNNSITIENIPAKAYEYVVNGKSAIEWIMERYQITTHKESGITNDPNDWSDEVGNPRYILDLLLSVINVSVQTVDIVKGLPKLNFS